MIHIFINALAASAGGGLTYIRNVIPQISIRNDVRATLLLNAQLRHELGNPPNVAFVEQNTYTGAIRRFWLEQSSVSAFIHRSGADVLLSAGNFALWNSPVPQILLSRNSLYTSSHFTSDLRSRGDYRLWLDTQVKGAFAKWSIGAADCVIAPSEAFAEELRGWTGKPVMAIQHGFDRESFVRDQSPLPDAVQAKLDAGRDALRLLFVSHYNYYRNFETLIRALPLIKRKLGTRPVRLFLTCKLRPGANPGEYRPDSAAALVSQLGLKQDVVELGSVPYRLLHRVYAAADIYVTPSYAESFAHPLVEAMAGGLPVIASDIAVHREICGTAALYFSPFSPEGLADQVVRLEKSTDRREELLREGATRSKTFSWRKHVDEVVLLAARVIRSRHTERPATAV
jgi:glycosyltransferase involved in cell wall biosynthesis